MSVDPTNIKTEILKGKYDEIAIKLNGLDNTIINLLLNAELSHGLGAFDEQFHYASKVFELKTDITLSQSYEAYYWMAWARFRQGKHQIAFDIAEEALQSIKELNSSEKEQVVKEHGRLLNVIASYNIESGNLDKGIYYLEESFQLIKRLKDIPLLSNCYNNLAYAYHMKGVFTRAIADYTTALSLLGEHDYPSHRARIYSNMGEVYRILGDYNLSLHYHNQALVLRRSLMNNFNLAIQLRYIGILHFEMNLISDAEKFLKNSIQLFENLDNELWYSASLFDYCRVILGKGEIVDNELSKLFDLYRQTENQIINNRYLLIKAMDLMRSPRMNQKSEAQRIFRKLFEWNQYDFEISSISKIQYLKLLFEEIKLSYHKDIVLEAIEISRIILKTVQENNIFSKKVFIYLVLSRLYLLLWDLKKANAYHKQADLLLMEFVGDTSKINNQIIHTAISKNIVKEEMNLKKADKMYNNGENPSIEECFNIFGISDLFIN